MKALADTAVEATVTVTRPFSAEPLLAYLGVRAMPGTEEVDGLVDWLRAVKVQGTQLSDVGILLRTNSQIDHLAPKLFGVSIGNLGGRSPIAPRANRICA